MLSAGAISHDGIKLFTATSDFVAFFYFTGYVVLIRLLVLVGAKTGRPVPAKF